MDKLVKNVPDGGNRIQCIEIKTEEPLLLVSIYCPSKNSPDNTDSFDDCFDQLFEIVQKVKDTHMIIIGGDFNEDIAKGLRSDRLKIVTNFMSECELVTQFKGPTFINVHGQEVSELDYFMYQEDIRIKGSKKLSDLTTNVSDHYPVLLGINIDIEHTSYIREEAASNRIVWDKVDKQKYAELVDLGIMDIQGDLDNEQMDLNELENVITKTHSVLRDSAEKSNTKRKYGKNRLTLKVWNEEISCKLRANRVAHKAWKKGRKPQLINNPLLVAKQLTRLEYRRAIRNEVPRKRLDTKTKIIETKTYDKKLFFKLVKKQRQSGNSSINDLMVGDEMFEG